MSAPGSPDGEFARLVAFLLNPETYGLDPAETVEKIETHISIVFLAGGRAYKLKKRVDYVYLDFTTLKSRKIACEAELHLNRRTAPELYLGLTPVRRVDGAFVLGGDAGEAVEWLVEMARFDQNELLASLAAEGRLPLALIEQLAGDIAVFHARAETRRDKGGPDAMRWLLGSNEKNFVPYLGTIFEQDVVAGLMSASRGELDARARLLEERREAGWVRLCHGDLHLGNVVRIDGLPVMFDCIEFSDDMACIDVLYDLAFLLMDLEFRARSEMPLQGFANRVLNAYLDRTHIDALGPTVEGLALLPLFMAIRAAVRSHVAARSAGSAVDPTTKTDEARAYAEFARKLLDPKPPRLVAVGGLSGTGKSTLAKALSPLVGAAPGAVHIRSDVLRKQIIGRPLLEPLPPVAYTREANAEVYARMGDLAARALAAGRAVMLDAVFARPDERDMAAEVAAAADVPFSGVWLDASTDTLTGRVLSRSEAPCADPSDATVDVVLRQLGYDLGEIDWARVDASEPADETFARARKALGL